MDRQQITRYRALDFFARQVVEGFITGRHRSPFHGFSVEFSDYRQYNPGEDTRNIDWHLYGRTDKLFVKQFQEETNLRCRLVIDHSTSMLFPIERHADPEHPNKLTFAAYAAAVLTEVLHRQRDAFGLTLISDGIDQQTPTRSSATHQRYIYGLLDELLQPVRAESRPMRRTAPAEALHLMAEQLHRRSLVVLFTDAIIADSEQEALFDALRHLRHNNHEVVLFHTYHESLEVNLDYGTQPVRFVDLESGSELRLSPSQAAEAYREQMQRTFAALGRRAMQYKIDYVPVNVELGFHQVLQPFMLKRNKM